MSRPLSIVATTVNPFEDAGDAVYRMPYNTLDAGRQMGAAEDTYESVPLHGQDVPNTTPTAATTKLPSVPTPRDRLDQPLPAPPSTSSASTGSTIRPVTTASPYSSSSGVPTSPPSRNMQKGHSVTSSFEYDVARARRGPSIKGKERAWDLDIERGDDVRFASRRDDEEEHVDGVQVNDVKTNGVGFSEAGMGTAAYPPMTDEEAEEKRIQENLAMFAARDLARRRAARASRLYVPAPAPDPPSSSGTGGILDLGTFKGKNKRSSMFGFLRLPGAGSEDGEGRREEELGSYPQPRSRPTGPNPNPFDDPYSTTTTVSPPHRRERTGSEGFSTRATEPQPGIERSPTPLSGQSSGFAATAAVAPRRPRSGAGSQRAEERTFSTGSNRSNESESAGLVDDGREREKLDNQACDPSIVPERIPYVDVEDGYKGETWRGGNAVASSHLPARTGSRSVVATGPKVTMRRDRWWHALCAWGDDLDDGEDGQAGRTNPFE